MNFYNLILGPLVLGLIGFVEPCSIGINMIILSRIKHLIRIRRIWETFVFTLVRGSFLALVGLSAAFIGGRIILIQSSFFLILGGVYIIMGVLALVNKYRPIFKAPIDLGKRLQNRGNAALGIVFGPVIPACAIPLVLALIGGAILAGDLMGGFVSLFIFGVGLSLPLMFISSFDRSNEIVTKISEKISQIPWLAGIVLIVVGLLTILSSTWWAGAAG